MEQHSTNTKLHAQTQTRKLILAALFAALTFVATTAFRIPLPAAVGAPFIHLGNSMVALSVLFLGFRYGASAGAIGFLVFDLLNGYAAEAPLIVIETFLVGAAISLTFKAFKEEDNHLYKVTLSVFAGIIVKIVATFGEGILKSMIAGVSFNAAAIASFTSLPATCINAIGTVIIVSVLYYPVKQIIKRTIGI